MENYWNDTEKGKPSYKDKKKLPPRNEVWAIVGLFKTDIYLHYTHETLISYLNEMHLHYKDGSFHTV
jgi:hypothetical protein